MCLMLLTSVINAFFYAVGAFRTISLSFRCIPLLPPELRSDRGGLTQIPWLILLDRLFYSRKFQVHMCFNGVNSCGRKL